MTSPIFHVDGSKWMVNLCGLQNHALPIPSHVWYIYLHLVDFYGISVGTCTVRPMDAMDRHHVDLPAAKNLP